MALAYTIQGLVIHPDIHRTKVLPLETQYVIQNGDNVTSQHAWWWDHGEQEKILFAVVLCKTFHNSTRHPGASPTELARVNNDVIHPVALFSFPSNKVFGWQTPTDRVGRSSLEDSSLLPMNILI